MAKTSSDAPGLGYTYHFPSGGVMLRIRNTLSQFSDLFSEFNKYIAPAYHHDRCERSVPMRLYSMSKREFVMAILSFFVCFGLSIFIGLAGPPITTTTRVTGKDLLANTTKANDKDIMATGPFVMRTPTLTTYSQQLWVIGRMTTDNRDDEKYDKTFQVNVALDGLTIDHKRTTILKASNIRNRWVCERMNSLAKSVITILNFYYIAGQDIYCANEMNATNLRSHIWDSCSIPIML